MPIKTCPLALAPQPLRVIAALALSGLAAGCFAPEDADMNLDGTETEMGSSSQGPGATTQAPSSTSGGDETGMPSSDSDGSGETGGEPEPEESSSSSGGGDSSSGGEESTGAQAEAPSIVEITPADGATGVHADSAIIVQFSEAMDKAATQAGYQSVDLPAAAVTFEWNAAGDELTITPNAPLEYAEGDDPDSTDALSYSFTLTTAAESELGEALPEDTEVTFSTLRRLSQGFEDDPLLSGRVRDLGGASLIGGSYLLGDASNNDVGRGFVSFDVSSLAEGPLTVEAASFHARWSQQIGNPFIDLGAVVYQHVAYDTFDNALFDTPGIGAADGLFGMASEDEVDRDVTSVVEEVLSDAATYEERVQFRMFWVFSETDGDGQNDGVTLIASDLGLELTYLAP